MAARKKARAAYGSGGRPRLRKDGRWVAYAPYTNPRTGKRDRHPSYGATAEAAVAKRDEFLRLQQDPRGVLDDRTTVGQWLAEWLELRLSSSGGDSHKLSHERVVKKHILDHPIAAVPVSTLKPIQIERWLVDLRARFAAPQSGRGDPRTVQIAFDVLKMALRKAVKNGLAGANPADDVERPRYFSPEKTIPSDEALDTFLESLQGSYLHPIVELIVATGLRRGEALALKWDDFDEDNKTLTVRRTETKKRTAQGRETVAVGEHGKTKAASRTLPLHADTVHLLRRHRQVQRHIRIRVADLWHDEKWIFTTQTGRRLVGRNVLRTLKARASQFGLEDQVKDLHSLRHHFATTGLKAGVDAPAMARAVGHSRASTTTDIYGHATPEGMDRAAEAASPTARKARRDAREARRRELDEELDSA